MRITIWHTDRYPTAPGVYLGCFPAMGHEVTWVEATAGACGGIVERREGGVRYLEVRRREDSRLPAPLGTLVTRWRKLAGFLLKVRLMERLARERPDVLQVRDLVTEGLLGLRAARRHRVRFAYQLDHPHFEGRLVDLDLGARGGPLERPGLWVWIRLRRIVLRGADLVLPISAALAEILRDREGVDPRRMMVFPVGVAGATLGRGANDAVDPRVAPLSGSPVVCYLGNLMIRRDPGLIFRIFEEVGRRVPESRFLVLAGMPQVVRESLKGLSVTDRVTFVPFVPHDEVPALLRAARVGIYPIPVDDRHGVNRSCSPLKVVEYMSAGLAVVASRVRDAEEALAQSGGGVSVATDAGAFADAIEPYLRDPERARRDGSRGRAWVAEHRTFDVLAREVEAGYRRLLETGVPAATADLPARADDFSVALVGPYPPPHGGLSIHIERLHQRLAALGVRSRVYCQPLPASRGRAKGIVPARFRFRWYGWVLGHGWRCDSDVVHFYEGWRWAPAAWFALARGKRVVMSFHNQQVTGEMWQRTPRPARWASRRLVGHPRIWWVGATRAVKEQLVEMGADPARITVAPAYIPPPPPAGTAGLPAAIRDFLAAHSPILSTYAFQLSRDLKGVDVYGCDQCIELAAALRGDHPRVGLVIRMSKVADEAYFHDLGARVAAAGLEDHVLFTTEALEDAQALWQASDVFVRATNTDGDALAVREALGLRVPVVASDVSARPAGTVLFRVRDTGSLVAAVREVLAHHADHVRALGSVAIEDNFPPLLELYRAIAQRGPIRP